MLLMCVPSVPDIMLQEHLVLTGHKISNLQPQNVWEWNMKCVLVKGFATITFSWELRLFFLQPHLRSASIAPIVGKSGLFTRFLHGACRHGWDEIRQKRWVHGWWCCGGGGRRWWWWTCSGCGSPPPSATLGTVSPPPPPPPDLTIHHMYLSSVQSRKCHRIRPVFLLLATWRCHDIDIL